MAWSVGAFLGCEGRGTGRAKGQGIFWVQVGRRKPVLPVGAFSQRAGREGAAAEGRSTAGVVSPGSKVQSRATSNGL